MATEPSNDHRTTAPEHAEADIERRLANLRAQRDGINAGDVDDPAACRLKPSALRQAHKHTDARLERYTRLTEQIQALEFRLADAKARLKDSTARRYTAEDLKGAKVVEDQHGARYAVIRVNRTTVSVEAGFPWPHRIAIDRIRGADR